MPVETETLNLDGWTFRLRAPEETGSARVLLLIHGWMGNEDVMWIFTHRFPPRFWMLAPRAPLEAPGGGYGWEQVAQSRAELAGLAQPAADLLARVDSWAAARGVNASQLDLMGFSQGAAVVYTLALLHPQRVRRAAALAGYLPGGWESAPGLKQLAGKPFFIAHGSRDETIPVARAQAAASALQSAGAQVTYCESDTGHKLGANCLKSLELFFTAGEA